MASVPMPKDYVKFSNKVLCMVQGTIQKRSLGYEAERVTMKLMKKLLDEGVLINNVMQELMHEGKVYDFKTLNEL